jgi:anti-anti-sigma regulatory factor
VDGKILFAKKNGVHVLKFVGDVRVTLGPTIGSFLDSIGECPNFKSVIIDLTETIAIDSTSLGMMAKISVKTQESFSVLPTIISTNDDITRILVTMGFEQVFAIIRQPLDLTASDELPFTQISEKALREQVLDAHKALMVMNTTNHETFKDLVIALEAEQAAGNF